MGSHILLPKCILKNFEDEKQSLYCYDIANKKFCMKRAKSFNTEKGHYSDDVENFLSDTVETPLGNLVKKLNMYFIERKILFSFEDYNAAISYCRSLLSRSAEMKSSIHDEFSNKEEFNQQDINNFSAVNSFKIAEQDGFFSDYNLAFIFLTGEKDFVLPLQGHCDYVSNDLTFFVVPLTPRIAAYFYKGKELYDKAVTIIDEQCEKFNRLSFIQQREKGYGYIISNKKKTIENLVNKVL